jgi:hypothetical protein
MLMNIGPLSFPTKTAARDHFRAILWRHPVGQEMTGPDVAEVAALLDLHHARNIKIGCGVAGFVVKLDRFNNRYFEIRRTDGSRTDFSYLQCLTPTPARTRFVGALRRAVAPDIVAARNAYMKHHNGRIVCAETDVPLTLDQAHLDHRYPDTFEALVNEFTTARKLTDYEALIAEHNDNDTEDRLADPMLAAEFRTFHLSRAELDFVIRRVNLARRQTKRQTEPQIILRLWVPSGARPRALHADWRLPLMSATISSAINLSTQPM